MTSIELTVAGAAASAKLDGVLTAGMVGVPVNITWDSEWDDLVKTLVCQSGVGKRLVLQVGNTAFVAPDVLQLDRFGRNALYIGLEGRREDGTLVITSTLARVGEIQPGAIAEGDLSVTPDSPAWVNVVNTVRSLNEQVVALKKALQSGATGQIWFPDGGVAGQVLAKKTDADQDMQWIDLPEKGQDGITPHIGSNGNWYLGTTDTGKPSRGETGAAGTTGATGATGSPGKDGYTPVKGTDYWTEEDKDEIRDEDIVYLSQELAKRQQLTPEFANEVAECTDTGKLYVLPDGYIYAYTKGGIPDTVEQDGFDIAVDSSGSPYNDGQGWKDHYRLNSTGVESAYSGESVTGFIPVSYGDVITIQNAIQGSNTSYFHYYDSSFAQIEKIPDSALTGTIPNVTITVANENAAYFRCCARFYEGSSDHEDTVITVSSKEETGKVYRWANTGHAFVPADYENRILALESRAAEGETIPAYVKAEADSVIDRVVAAQGERTFTFAAITDMHYGNGGYTEGVDHACRALKYIDSRIKLDAVAVLGDYTDGMASNSYAGAVADCRDVNSVLDGLRFAPNLRVQGNHDFYKTHAPEMYRYISAYSDNVVWGSKLGGYFYRDFEDIHLRVICLNTAEENSSSLSCSVEQYSWFAQTLDLSGKEDPGSWQTLILSHHPLDWFASGDTGYVFWQILGAYLEGSIWSGCDVYDYAGKNDAKIIANIHGHIHNLLTRKIAAGQPNTTQDTIDVLRMATPEACYDRENQYNGTWDLNPFGEDTSYPKTQGAAEETAFCIYCIDLESRTIHGICYGAGYDREIDY